MNPDTSASSITRRHFLGAAGLAAGLAASGRLRGASAAAAGSTAPIARVGPREILGFGKPFIHLNLEEAADLVAEVGWDGIDCPVRATLAAIKPERVEEDLPPMVEALKRRGKTVPIVTTDIVRLDARAEKVLRTLAALGIKSYRFGFVRYPKDRPAPQRLQEFSAALRDLSAINRELGLRGGYQNHSGTDYLGATIWELWLAMKDLEPGTVGLCYDIGQAMVEGGLSWPTQMTLLQSQWLAIQIKDFVWENATPRGWDVRWCPLGQGRVTPAVLDTIAYRTFAGPLIQHHEHIPPRMPRAELVASLKREFETLRSWLA
ncbi:MAG TPA: TIM barrel protein [Opitutaceae bacterium]